MNIDRETFFSGFRELFGKLTQKQVDGLEFLLGQMEKDSWSLPQAAYVLATVAHETANTFQPIKEFRSREGSKGRANQDRYWLTGFYGRGYVQLTWRKNYEKFGIADDPDSALEPEVAYDVLSRGMKFGMFTGHGISEFINDDHTDYVNARRVVNGLDKAQDIAKIARRFEAILGPATAERPDKPLVHVEVEDKPEPPPQKIEPPAAPQAPKPEVTPVGSPKGSIVTKIAAGASAMGPILGATGLKIGGVEFKTGGLIAFAAVLIVGMVLAAWIYNEDRKRADRRQERSMENLANPNRENIVVEGTRV